MDQSTKLKQIIYKKYLKLSQEQEKPLKRPMLVALCGVPGSGKSTLAKKVKDQCLTWPKVAILSMDGYHIPLKGLPEERVYFRGAVDTFDLDRFKNDLLRLKSPSQLEKEFKFPGFDHAKGDPEEDKFSVFLGEGGDDIVLVEGLYVLSDGLNELFDLCVFIDSDVDKCIEGLKERNKVIPGYTPEEIEERCERVDRQNALFVETLKKKAEIVLEGYNL